MDAIVQLRCRNTELETELRLIKEQLAQAHAATNYLVTTFSSQRSAQAHSASARLEECLERAQQEIAHLSALLVSTGQHGMTVPVNGHHRTNAIMERFTSQAPPSPPSTILEQDEQTVDDDLLSFDDENDAAIATPQPLPSQQQHDLPVVADGETVHKIDHADGSHSFVMATPASFFPPPTGPRWQIPHRLYCHLLGRACFAEDWDDEKWGQYARQNSVLSVTEWQEYYTEVVRPRYLEIEAVKASTDSCELPEPDVGDAEAGDAPAVMETVDAAEKTTVDSVEETIVETAEDTTVAIVEKSTVDNTEKTTVVDNTDKTTVDTAEKVTVATVEKTTIDTVEKTTVSLLAHHLLTPEFKNMIFSRSSHDDLRTVLITGLPPTITLAEVLDKVRGGKICSAQLLRTNGMRYAMPAGREKMNGALITFLYSPDARTYVDYVSDVQDVFFWHESWDAAFKAKVELVGTSSRVVPERVKHVGASRIVYLADNGGNGIIELTARVVVGMVMDWGMEDRNHWRGLQHNPPIRADRDKDGILVFEFAGMMAADHFKFALERLGAFTGMGAGFLPDGCAKEVATLAEVAFAERPAHCATGSDSEQDGSTASPEKEPEYAFTTATTASDGRYKSDDLELARALMSSFTRAGERKEVRGRGKMQGRVEMVVME